MRANRKAKRHARQYKPREDQRNRRAIQPPSHVQDQERVHPHGNRPRGERHEHRPLAIPFGPQRRRPNHAHRHHRERRDRPQQVPRRKIACLALSAHQLQQRIAKADNQCCDHCLKDHRNDHRRGRLTPCALSLSFADAGRYHHRRCNHQTNAGADRKELHRKSIANRRHQFRVTHLRQPEQVREIHKENKGNARRPGERHAHHMPHGRPGQKTPPLRHRLLRRRRNIAAETRFVTLFRVARHQQRQTQRHQRHASC